MRPLPACGPLELTQSGKELPCLEQTLVWDVAVEEFSWKK